MSVRKTNQLPEITSLAKKFMNDPSVFSMNDADEAKRGPGSYELPSIFAKKKNASNLNNYESFEKKSKILDKLVRNIDVK